MSLLFRVLEKINSETKVIYEDDDLSGYCYVPLFDWFEENGLIFKTVDAIHETASDTLEVDKTTANKATQLIGSEAFSVNQIAEEAGYDATDLRTAKNNLARLFCQLDREPDGVSYIFELY